jgi:hypothetical protein
MSLRETKKWCSRSEEEQVRGAILRGNTVPVVVADQDVRVEVTAR